jgi:hypothetical protein
MAENRSPSRVNASAWQEADLSQILRHGPAMRIAYGKALGSLIMLAAIMKANRGPMGMAAGIALTCTVAYRLLSK